MNPTYIDKYINYIKDLLNNHISVADFVTTDEFKKFRQENLITFRDAAIVDQFFLGYYGEFWTSAYDYPKEGEIIINKITNHKIGKACNVGILTFSII